MIDRSAPETQSYQHPPIGVLLAQRAFAAFLDIGSRTSRSERAGVQASVRSTLSVLSADDRNLLDRWIALQLVTHAGAEAARRLSALARIDAWLSAAVRTQLPRIARELMQPAHARPVERIAA